MLCSLREQSRRGGESVLVLALQSSLSRLLVEKDVFLSHEARRWHSDDLLLELIQVELPGVARVSHIHVLVHHGGQNVHLSPAQGSRFGKRVVLA